MALYTESHLSINVSVSGTVLSYTHNGTVARTVLCRVKAGSVLKPIIGNATYVLRTELNGVHVAPDSQIIVLTDTVVVVQSREIMLEPDDILVVKLKGASGDVDIETDARLVDTTPLTQADIYGAGEIPVDHNTGGTDALRVTLPLGAGVSDVAITAYLTSDYNAGDRTASFVRGRTSTGVDGRWLAPLLLSPAVYTLVYSKPSEIVTRTSSLTVT